MILDLPLAPAVTADVQLALDVLVRQPGVRRIWLFGSVARGRPLDWRSDLDLAVEGLPAPELPGLWSSLDARLQLPLDLIRWEEASEALRTQILRTGRVIYEA